MALMADGDDARASLPVARTRLLDRPGTSLAAFLIVAAVLLGASFGPRLRGEFVWDDIYLVEGNQAIFRADGWRVLLLHDLWGPVTGKPSQLYHPVPMLSLWLQGISHTGSLVGLRLANLVLHGLCAGLLWLFIVRRGVGRAAALAAAAAGNVDAAIVYKTDALISKKVTIAYEVPLAEGPRISYPIAGIKASAHPKEAKTLLLFLESSEALGVFKKYGFLLP